jgi:hypothetical protein
MRLLDQGKEPPVFCPAYRHPLFPSRSRELTIIELLEF